MEIAPTRLFSIPVDLTVLLDSLDLVPASCAEASRASDHSPKISSLISEMRPRLNRVRLKNTNSKWWGWKANLIALMIPTCICLGDYS
jgi:hypothetical protein